MKKPKKIDRYGRTYQKRLFDLLKSSLDYHPCADCGSPVIRGYCCRYCGSTDPDRK